MASNKFKELMASMKDVDKLAEEFKQANSRQSYDDNRFWKPSVDKAGNGYAVIRFLPLSEADTGKVSRSDVSVTMYNHAFKGPHGKWYIENSRTTIGEKDPVSDYNSKLWNSGQQDEARKQKRKVTYISNIMVLKDEKNPEAEGKVFLFQYGAKIKAKIEEALEPKFPDQPKFSPFDFERGANFKLKIRKGDGGFRNYDSSEFETPAPLFGKVDDDAYEKVWNSQHALSELITPDKFKPYKDLEKKFNEVMGFAVEDGAARPAAADEDDETPPWDETPRASPKPVAAVAAKPLPTISVDEGEDDDLDMFRKLAN